MGDPLPLVEVARECSCGTVFRSYSFDPKVGQGEVLKGICRACADKIDAQVHRLTRRPSELNSIQPLPDLQIPRRVATYDD